MGGGGSCRVGVLSVVRFLLFIFFFRDIIIGNVAAWEEFLVFSWSCSGHWKGFGGMNWSLDQYGALRYHPQHSIGPMELGVGLNFALRWKCAFT